MPADTTASPKRATNVSLSAELIDEAKRLKINISHACETGLIARVAEARAEAWLAENRHSLESSNAWVERHGLPLARYRLF